MVSNSNLLSGGSSQFASGLVHPSYKWTVPLLSPLTIRVLTYWLGWTTKQVNQLINIKDCYSCFNINQSSIIRLIKQLSTAMLTMVLVLLGRGTHFQPIPFPGVSLATRECLGSWALRRCCNTWLGGWSGGVHSHGGVQNAWFTLDNPIYKRMKSRAYFLKNHPF